MQIRARGSLPELVAWTLLPGSAWAEDDRYFGGFGGLLSIGIAVAIVLFLMQGLGAICEFINGLVDRAPDDDYGPKVLMLGGMIASFAGIVFALLQQDRHNLVENALVAGGGIWLFLAWLWNRN